MKSRNHQRLLVSVLFSFIIFIFVDCKESGNTPPNLQPLSAPASGSSSQASAISFAPSASDPPSESISPSGSDSPSDSPSEDADHPSDADLPLEWISPSTNVDPSVKKICDSTDYPSLCLATVVPVLNENTDASSVLEVTMKATNKLATFAVSVMKKFAEGPGLPPRVVKILNDCEDSFDTVLYNYERALNAFSDRDIGTMNTMLSASITDIGDCDDQLSKYASASAVSSYSDRLINMTSNCLAIVSLIQ